MIWRPSDEAGAAAAGWGQVTVTCEACRGSPLAAAQERGVYRAARRALRWLEE